MLYSVSRHFNSIAIISANDPFTGFIAMPANDADAGILKCKVHRRL